MHPAPGRAPGRVRRACRRRAGAGVSSADDPAETRGQRVRHPRFPACEGGGEPTAMSTSPPAIAEARSAQRPAPNALNVISGNGNSCPPDCRRDRDGGGGDDPAVVGRERQRPSEPAHTAAAHAANAPVPRATLPIAASLAVSPAARSRRRSDISGHAERELGRRASVRHRPLLPACPGELARSRARRSRHRGRPVELPDRRRRPRARCRRSPREHPRRERPQARPTGVRRSDRQTARCLQAGHAGCPRPSVRVGALAWHHRGERGERRLRSGRTTVLAAASQHPDKRPHLLQRLAALLLDANEHRRRRPRIGCAGAGVREPRELPEASLKQLVELASSRPLSVATSRRAPSLEARGVARCVPAAQRRYDHGSAPPCPRPIRTASAR